MSRPFTPKVLTANALLEGDVVYATADGAWTRNHAEAELLQDETLADLKLLDAEARGHEVVGAYLADAKAGPNGPEPTHFRDGFRSRGPSNYAHGKQSDLKASAH